MLFDKLIQTVDHAGKDETEEDQELLSFLAVATTEEEYHEALSHVVEEPHHEPRYLVTPSPRPRAPSPDTHWTLGAGPNRAFSSPDRGHVRFDTPHRHSLSTLIGKLYDAALQWSFTSALVVVGIAAAWIHSTPRFESTGSLLHLSKAALRWNSWYILDAASLVALGGLGFYLCFLKMSGEATRLSLDSFRGVAVEPKVSGTRPLASSSIREHRPLRRISFLCLGSRGDIQPYVVLAMNLKRRGYQIRFLTHDSYVPLVQSFGLEGIAVAGDFEPQMRTLPTLRHAMSRGSARRAAQGLAEVAQWEAPRLSATVLQDLQTFEPDLFLPNTLAYYFGWYAALHLDIPFIQLAMQDLVYNPHYMMLGLPTLPFGLHYYVLYYILLPTVYGMFRPYDHFVGQEYKVGERITLSRFRQELFDPRMPMLIMMSPLIAQTLYPRSPSMHMYVGTTVMESEDQVDHPDFGGHIQPFLDFLNQGPAVYLGWGSMMCQSTEHMTLKAIRAVRYAGVRAIILGGYARISAQVLQESRAADKEVLLEYASTNVMWVESAPHEWLFPRVMCAVHHGGSGTTTAALRAGVPTIVTPVYLDQFDFSYAVRELGVGRGFAKPLGQISWQELGDAIVHACHDRAVQGRAKMVGQELRKERGAELATNCIELLWRDFIQTGKFDSALSHVANVSPSL